MIKLYMAIRDTKAEQFLPPFLVPTLGVAYRDVQDAVNRGQKENPLSSYPNDFELWQLGTFDDESGEIFSSPQRLLNVASLLTPSSPA
ncbi:MAG: nonstructural protein [Arizlama microvirus]|nr:MAG: nonstructural protein [Arizlama microvirus]